MAIARTFVVFIVFMVLIHVLSYKRAYYPSRNREPPMNLLTYSEELLCSVWVGNGSQQVDGHYCDGNPRDEESQTVKVSSPNGENPENHPDYSKAEYKPERDRRRAPYHGDSSRRTSVKPCPSPARSMVVGVTSWIALRNRLDGSLNNSLQTANSSNSQQFSRR